MAPAPVDIDTVTTENTCYDDRWTDWIDYLSIPIFGADSKGRVNSWNFAIAKCTGYSAKEALHLPLVGFVEGGSCDKFRSSMDHALCGRSGPDVVLNLQSKFRGTILLLVKFASQRDTAGKIAGVVCFATEISDPEAPQHESSGFDLQDRTQTETRRDPENKSVGVVSVSHDVGFDFQDKTVSHEVEESVRKERAMSALARELRQLSNCVPTFGIDVDGNVNEWNGKTAEITGFSKEEAFHTNLVKTFIVPSLRDSVQEVLDNALQGIETSNYKLLFTTKSSEIRHLLVNATPRRNESGNVVGVVGVAQDVTESVQQERAVAGMANELRRLIDKANAPIFGIDVDGDVNEWNEKTAEITGFTKQEAFDCPLVSTFIVPSLRDSVQSVLDNALNGIETSNYELEFRTKSNDIRHLLVNATTRRDAENNIVGVVGVAQDVTEDRRHAKELREMQSLRASQEAKVETERNMTAYFAHELRNPLHAIDNALAVMPADDLPESAKSLVKGMQLCCGFMASIMNNLLDVRKMEEGKLALNSAPISLSALLDSVHKMLHPSVRAGIRFEKICTTSGKDWVLGDSHRIQQVMTNVVTNAIKYTLTGSITLIVEWEGEYVRFECADTGPGIPKSEQKKLFERFVQRGGAPGTGLGLAIAKHLVDLTGGSIRFHSDPAVKAGTSCVVLMPLPPCSRPELGAREDPCAVIEEPLTFLIIDDVKMNRMMLKRRIRKGVAPNAIITEASTGEEALIICGKDKFDVVVVDQYMEEAGGVMVGTDVVFAMRRMRINSIIIGCSGNDMDELFAEAGADWVWKKPMPSNSTMIQELRNALAGRL